MTNPVMCGCEPRSLLRCQLWHCYAACYHECFDDYYDAWYDASDKCDNVQFGPKSHRCVVRCAVSSSMMRATMRVRPMMASMRATICLRIRATAPIMKLLYRVF
jgi:hypothetical protein